MRAFFRPRHLVITSTFVSGILIEGSVPAMLPAPGLRPLPACIYAHALCIKGSTKLIFKYPRRCDLLGDQYLADEAGIDVVHKAVD